MIDNYPELNRDETIAAVSDFGADRLQEFIAFEREHKNRTTVVEPLERKLVTVTPAGGQKYVAGLWFDDPDETQVTRRTTRVERAIANEDLREVA
ncbi:hypothetical protein GWK26_12620 [haloarchaeon 3A1-DGR]|nr:hypothetical protein GWK26_12620 [haloarchaeon 3A1-DGR]